LPAQPELPVFQPQQKTISAHYNMEGDSDQLPSVLVLSNFSDLKVQLSELCGIKNMETKDFRVILDHREVILNLIKIQDGAEYEVTKKVKNITNLVKFYMDKR
jgi:hypothetical protein